jgi:nucleoid-associated protein YgaU
MSTRAKMVTAGAIVAALAGLVVLDLTSSKGKPRESQPDSGASGVRFVRRPPSSDAGTAATDGVATSRERRSEPTRVVLNPSDIPPRSSGTLTPPPQPNPATAATEPTVPQRVNSTPATPVPPAPAPLVERRSEEPVAAPAARTYEVQTGDSLWKIAERFYGDGRMYTVILEANPGASSGSLQPGTRLTIPPAPERRTAASSAPAAMGGRTYTIRQGDTLAGIAQQFYQNGALAMALFEANRDVLSNPNVLIPGKTIRVPEDLARRLREEPAVGTGRAGVVPAGARIYRVQAGDSLWKIASRHAGSTSTQEYLRKLVEVNRDRLPQGTQTIIQPGWELVLPE